MNCPRCDSALPEDAAFCPSCGNRARSGPGTGGSPTHPYSSARPPIRAYPRPGVVYYQQPAGLNELCVVGAVVGVVSLLLPLFGITGIIGLACSIGGVCQTSRNSQRGSALGVIGIVLSVLSLVYVVFLVAQASSLAS